MIVFTEDVNENQAIVESGVTPDDRLYLSMPADISGLPFWPIEEQQELARNFDS